MNYQLGNVTDTLYSLYAELLVMKQTLMEKRKHSPGWIYTRNRHRKKGITQEIYHAFYVDGKRRPRKVDPSNFPF